MKVAEFRELRADVLRAVNDFHACADREERAAWSARTAPLVERARTAQCDRASELDRARMVEAIEAYGQVEALHRRLEPPEPALRALQQPVVAAAGSGMSRAARYNKSASRAVRLSRAARAAQRRGYF